MQVVRKNITREKAPYALFNKPKFLRIDGTRYNRELRRILDNALSMANDIAWDETDNIHVLLCGDYDMTQWGILHRPSDRLIEFKHRLPNEYRMRFNRAWDACEGRMIPGYKNKYYPR